MPRLLSKEILHGQEVPLAELLDQAEQVPEPVLHPHARLQADPPSLLVTFELFLRQRQVPLDLCPERHEHDCAFGELLEEEALHVEVSHLEQPRRELQRRRVECIEVLRADDLDHQPWGPKLCDLELGCTEGVLGFGKVLMLLAAHPVVAQGLLLEHRHLAEVDADHVPERVEDKVVHLAVRLINKVQAVVEELEHGADDLVSLHSALVRGNLFLILRFVLLNAKLGVLFGVLEQFDHLVQFVLQRLFDVVLIGHH
mmetsp:Transcript_26252/g.63219  ORF Transcript_26252/g.63219 Transcript_26252/m.63219 type:complete len:256 (-) Transcript_26252:719-1486(-)